MPGGVVFDQGNVNIAALTTPGAYVQIVPPLGLTLPLPTNAVGIVGGASWGPVNKATALGSTTTATNTFGQFNQALNDPFDLARDILISFQQAQSAASLTVWGVRVTDGTDAAATYALKDTTAVTPLIGLTLTALYTGIAGNTITVVLTAGGQTGTYNVNIISSFSGLTNELYQNIPYTSAGSFWTALASAINFGQGNVRGPSQLVVAGTPNASAIAPAVSTGNGFALTGGLDGRTGLTSASFFGSDVSGNRTGVYALRSLTPTPTMFWCSGLTDSTKFANMQVVASSEIMIAMLSFPLGTTTAAAITSKNTVGISDYRVCFIKDWIYWSDPISGKTLLVPPSPFAGGRIATLSPELSPLNVNVLGVVGTERNGPQGNQVYNLDELGTLNTNGILVITNPVPGGYYWGFPVGNNSSNDPVRAPIEYSRMIDYISLSLAARMGKYVGKLQGTLDPDPTRSACKNELDEFCQFLKSNRQIDSFFNVCDVSINTPATIARRYLFANSYIKLLASIQFVVINLQGGTTVNTNPGALIAGSVSNS